MKYLKQIGIIFLFSLLGELCRYLIPLSIPASIYGMVLLFAALALKILPQNAVSDSGNFLVSILPVLFVAPTVNILASWDAIKDNLLAIALVIFVTTIITFAVAGMVTQWLLNKKGGSKHE